MRSEYIAAIILGLCILAAAIISTKNRKEVEKQIRAAIDDRDKIWAQAVDAVTAYRDQQFELYERIIDEKNVVIVEKQQRIEELENQVARNEALMNLVNVTESIRGKIDGTAKA